MDIDLPVIWINAVTSVDRGTFVGPAPFPILWSFVEGRKRRNQLKANEGLESIFGGRSANLTLAPLQVEEHMLLRGDAILSNQVYIQYTQTHVRQRKSFHAIAGGRADSAFSLTASSKELHAAVC